VAGVGAASELRNQLGAVAELRLRLTLNSLRSMRGKLELGARIFGMVMFSLAGLGIGTGAAFGSYFMVAQQHVGYITALLWVVFFIRQLVPLLVSSFGDALDLGSLLRLPLTYTAYFLVRLTFGAFDAASILSTMATLGIFVGILVADWRLAPWAAAVLLVFFIVNALIERTLATWVERWLAQRRTRELVAVLMFLLLFALQMIGPLMNRMNDKRSAKIVHVMRQVAPYQRALPPGAAGAAITGAARGHSSQFALYLAVLGVYAMGTGWLLHARLRAEYRGENLSEARMAERRAPARRTVIVPELAGGTRGGPLAALLEKEVRYLMRSGPLLFTFVMPVFFLFIFGMGRMRGTSRFLGSQYGFAIAVIYALMVMANFIYNSFGSDEAGVQVYFMLPVAIRTVAVAKNTLQALILVVEMAAMWAVVSYLFGRPSLLITLLTVLWTIFAMAVHMAVGNLLSLAMPKKAELGKFGRQKPATASAFIALGVHAVTVGLGTLVVWLSKLAGSQLYALLALAVLAAVAAAGYLVVLGRMDSLAEKQRESLIATLTRA
jgi:ABC-2 type transport system permease protein